MLREITYLEPAKLHAAGLEADELKHIEIVTDKHIASMVRLGVGGVFFDDAH